ncbi:hypothetical protein [Streptomyces indicus]|uniref:Aromatic ring-opening dioxygenase LigA n=1 Tax=Streptomyces indicus TaxID=417292 RepID=A0A1G9FF15_9ACTN|nr:hypothetical protein [Streptomyces indicus]SDK86959.1 hypothetical protein SAMN05421806_11381 [Streptomyces indicus]
MTTTPLTSAAPGTPATGRALKALRALAIAACVPYLSLKLVWISGGRTGIPDGSALLEHRTTMLVANTVTVLMDACVIVLALLLTRPWGLRVRSWLLTVPMWAATGLLLPIMTGFPLQLLIRVSGGSVRTQTAKEPFLDGWVFSVVYGGFIVQGLALGALFAAYARRRWGYVWRGRIADLASDAGLSPDTGGRLLACAATVCAVLPVTVHLMWALGADTGLNTATADNRAGDYYALEAMNALYPLAAVTGALLLTFGWGRRLRLRLPLGLVWAGSAATACWGGWLLLGSAGAGDVAEQPTGLMVLTYAGAVITGLLALSTGVRHAHRRAAQHRAGGGLRSSAPASLAGPSEPTA